MKNTKYLKNTILSGLCLCLLVVVGLPGFGQTTNSTNVEIKPSNPLNRIEEEKAIEFTIVGMTSENDVWAVEDVLTDQMGIDRARISGDKGYCIVITLKGSNIGKEVITAIIKTKGFTIENYSERRIGRKYDKPGEQVYLQDTPVQEGNGTVLKNKIHLVPKPRAEEGTKQFKK